MPAHDNTVAALIHTELGRFPLGVFAQFDPEPVAAASIGQVHRARLATGQDVAVKVQRPDIDELVERDLETILHIARRIESTTAWGRRAGVAELARGFADSLREELGYELEARNTATVAELPGGHHPLRVPRVFGDLSARRVLVLLEWLDGTSLCDAGPLLDELGADRTNLARGLLANFLAQVLQTGVFNADSHPGNVLVMPDGTRAQIDFGSVGRLDSLQRLGARASAPRGRAPTPSCSATRCSTWRRPGDVPIETPSIAASPTSSLRDSGPGSVPARRCSPSCSSW
jgi:ubiquinone biosynthesis protein